MEGPARPRQVLSQSNRGINRREVIHRLRRTIAGTNHFCVICTSHCEIFRMSSSVAHLSQEAMASLPRHVAIIMDGNGRWAKQRHLPRVEGHRMGAESVRAVIRAAGELGIKYLTLYAFSVENWNRPTDEVDTLMKYLAHYMNSEFAELNKKNVGLGVMGQIHRLPEVAQKQLYKTRQPLSNNHRL